MNFHPAILPLLLAIAVQGPAIAAQKTPITNANDLPRRSYQLKGTVKDILNDKAQLDRLAEELLQNLQKDLATYDIQDKATRVAYANALTVLYLRRGDPDRTLEFVRQARALETKAGAKLTSGLFAEVMIRTMRQVPDAASEAFAQAFEKNYSDAVSAMPLADIREYVDQTRMQAQMATPELAVAAAESNLQPVLEKTGGLVPEGVVSGLINLEVALTRRFPLNDEVARVLTRIVESSPVAAKTDLWKDREVTLDPASLQPVVIGIWDTGVDLASLPASQRYLNPRETSNGRDDDGNGYVDDLHGIGFDATAMSMDGATLDRRSAEVAMDLDRLHTLFTGSFNANAGRQGPDVEEFTRAFSQLKPEQVKEFTDALTYYGIFAHGTHVAGIAAAGNPAARVLAVRMTTPFRQPVPAHTLERSRWLAKTYREVIEYMRKSGVRVVNMSWRYTAGSIEGSLTANNIGRDAAERKAMARQMFDIEKQALYDAIKEAPGILFVCGSGNENNDADFSEYIPASFNLPNLVTVGAVDISGKKTSFTTEGRSVDFYAGGHEIESYAPRGKRMLLSGTSMSSPQVANLAAKMLALKPSLGPGEVVALIERGADASAEDARIKLINPKKTLELLKQ